MNRNLFLKSLPYLLISFVVISLLSCAYFLFFPIGLPETLTLDHRIYLSQLSVGLASVLALLLAALEFSKNQRYPKLKFWVVNLSDDKNDSQPSDKVEVHRVKIHGNRLGYLFSFAICLENYGNVLARYLKIHLELPEAPLNITFRRTSTTHSFGKWIPETPDIDSRKHEFFGGTDFLIYPHPPQRKLAKDWIETIGKFEVFIPQKSPLSMQIITCTVIADGFTLFNQPLKLILKQEHS